MCEYDTHNRLTRFVTDGIEATYTYGVDNLRTSKTVNGVTTGYVWNNEKLVAETDGMSIQKVHNYIIDGIAETVEADGKTFYYKDDHGDIIFSVDKNSTYRNDYWFGAFGNKLVEEMEYPNSFGYAGEYHDAETGLIYLRNRYYDPSVGRFINEDPIRDGLNWYAYCNNNPANYIDPLGLDAVLITADHSALWQGHTSIITQDTRNGNWYYFYWGDKATYFVEVPWEDGAMGSLDNFNSWLNNQSLPYSTKNYTSATFVEGDFNSSVDYFKELVNSTSIESGYKMVGTYNSPKMEYYQKNKDYDLFNSNCLQMSMKGFYKGTLKDGTKVNNFMKGQLDKTPLATIKPNTAENVFNQLFFNRKFTRVAAKNDVTWEALYGSPDDKYKDKGFFYAKTLGVSK